VRFAVADTFHVAIATLDDAAGLTLHQHIHIDARPADYG
jgi:hypothetical protein